MTDQDLGTLLRAHVEADEPPVVSPDRAIALGRHRIRRRRNWLVTGTAAAVAALSLGITVPRLTGTAPTAPSGPLPSPSIGPSPLLGPLKLLPPSCTAADHIRLGKVRGNGAGGDLFTEWPLLTDHPCTLYGYPSVKLLEASGEAAALRYHDQWPWFGGEANAPIEPVVVNDTTALTIEDVHKTTIHAGAFIDIEKYRCDTTRHPKALTKAEITLPIPGARPLVGRTHYELCDPGDDGSQVVEVSPVQTNAKPAPYAVNLRSSFSPYPWPYDTPTWGTADVDGDGRPDTVVLHPGKRYKPGLLVVHLASGKTLQATTEFSQPLRLQALSDLNDDGHAEILVSTTTLGADYHGVFADADAEVFTVVGGRLEPVMRGKRPWRLDFSPVDEGGGENGVRCQGHTVTQVTVDAQLTRTTFRIEGDRAVRVGRTTSRATGDGQQYATSSCPGMSSDGWAEPPQ